MGDLFRRGGVIFVTGLVAAGLAWSSLAQAQGEPPARVGRLAFTNGPVSFHDEQQSGWTPAVVNTPLTSGDAIWTEPNARSEVSLAGTRIRLSGATELDMLALADTETRLQLPQGRIDVKSTAMATKQPYQIVTPRGTVSLLQQGDYYVEAGSTEDPTRLGVRSGAAQIQSLSGEVLAVRPGEVGEVTGDAGMPQLRTIQAAPPPLAASWADRDRRIVYEQPPQYLSTDVTGYEDLNAYGSWVTDAGYGEVWVPRAVPAGWQPYRTGHWAYVQPWGWTWIDDQPWGFAPYHYGRWANSRGRWVWVPPQREARPVYAPALVAFVGGIELASALANRSSAPVGWFPLGPREAYVPPYTTNREYYQRINRAARIDDRVLDERWERAQRREAIIPGQTTLMNQRFATVVPTAAFVGSQPVMRSALRVAPNQIAAAPVAPVAAPPAPTVSIANAAVQPARTPAPSTTAPGASGTAAPSNIAVARTAVADMPTLAKPATTQALTAPGPKVAATQPTAPTADQSKPALPALVPRQGTAPPELKGAITPAPPQPVKPGEPPRQQQASPQPQAAPAAPTAAPPPLPAAQPHAAPQAAPTPPPQPGRPGEPPRQQQASPQPQAAPAAPTAAPPPPQQAKPAEPPRPSPQPPQAQPQPVQPQANAPPRPAAPSPQVNAPQQPAAPAQPQANTPPRAAAPPPPQVNAPQHPVAPAPPQANAPQRPPAPPPQVNAPQQPAAPQRQQSAPPPPQQSHAPPAPMAAPQHQQSAPAPQPAPPPQPPAQKPPNQAQAPAAQPQPHPAPPPQAHPAPQQPAPPPKAPQQKPDEKK
jgi:hypothetical protein